MEVFAVVITKSPRFDWEFKRLSLRVLETDLTMERAASS
jgi:hypothetical protein